MLKIRIASVTLEIPVIVLSDNVKIFFKSEDYMNEMATRLVLDANSVVTAHEDKVWACCRALEIALSKIFPNCQAHPFGSRVSGLGNQVIISPLIVLKKHFNVGFRIAIWMFSWISVTCTWVTSIRMRRVRK